MGLLNRLGLVLRYRNVEAGSFFEWKPKYPLARTRRKRTGSMQESNSTFACLELSNSRPQVVCMHIHLYTYMYALSFVFP